MFSAKIREHFRFFAERPYENSRLKFSVCANTDFSVFTFSNKNMFTLYLIKKGSPCLFSMETWMGTRLKSGDSTDPYHVLFDSQTNPIDMAPLIKLIAQLPAKN